MRYIIRALCVVGLGLWVSGCASLGMTLSSAMALMDEVNAGIETVDTFAHEFCPSAQVIGTNVQSVACAAKANGTTTKAINSAIRWGQAFCANPASTSVASLAAHTASGVQAILTARDAGCDQTMAF